MFRTWLLEKGGLKGLSIILSMTSELQQFTVFYMAFWKRVKCDWNGVKIACFCRKITKITQRVGTLLLGPLCDRRELHQFVQYVAKLDNFCAKKFTFGLSLFYLSKTVVALLVAFTAADRFFKRLYEPDAKQANKRCRLYTSLFFWTWTQNFQHRAWFVAVKYQFFVQQFSLF